VRAVSKISNARFPLRSSGFATFRFEADNSEFIFAGIGPDNFESLERSFNTFVQLFKDACDGIQPTQRLREAHAVFESAVIPALKNAGIEVVDAGDYSNSQVQVTPSGGQSPDENGRLLPARFSLKIPLRHGIRKFWGNAIYDAHARFEELLHIFQHLNEAPLTAMGAEIERLIRERDKSLVSLLTKSWDTPDRRARFVRENDIMGAYEEYGIDLPGIFLYVYDRRAVRTFLRSRRALQG
jgi:hypothetical protein